MSSDFVSCRYCTTADDEYICRLTDPSACTPCTKLRELEEQVKAIRSLLVKLEKRRQNLKMRANQHHDRLIRRLPHEIATEIFELCIPESLIDIDIDTNNLYPSLTISAVCKEWRNMAYAMPSLWRVLPLSSEHVNLNALPDPFFIKKWIERAGQLPLSILLRISSQDIDAGIGIVNVLNQYSTRWSEFVCESPATLFSYFPNTSEDLPELRSLRLSSTESFSDIPIKLYPQQLNVLVLAGIWFKAMDSGFNWTHLTQLMIFDATFLEVSEALCRAPNLTKCRFRHDPELESSQDDPESSPLLHDVVRPKIQEFDISTTLYEDIFPKLLCPALKALTLHDDNYSINMPLTITFLQRSGCFLERLTFFNGDGLTMPDITSICEAIPTLQHLSIAFSSIHHTLVPEILLNKLSEFSTINDSLVPLHLPALRSLSFEEETPYGLWDIIPRILPLAHLQRTRVALESITILASPEATKADWDVRPRINAAVLEEILRLREAGINLELQFGKAKEDWVDLAAINSGNNVPASTLP